MNKAWLIDDDFSVIPVTASVADEWGYATVQYQNHWAMVPASELFESYDTARRRALTMKLYGSTVVRVWIR